jgi:hypothetical protein
MYIIYCCYSPILEYYRSFLIPLLFTKLDAWDSQQTIYRAVSKNFGAYQQFLGFQEISSLFASKKHVGILIWMLKNCAGMTIWILTYITLDFFTLTEYNARILPCPNSFHYVENFATIKFWLNNRIDKRYG